MTFQALKDYSIYMPIRNIRTFLDPIRKNNERSRGTNKGRLLDEIIRCRIKSIIKTRVYM